MLYFMLIKKKVLYCFQMRICFSFCKEFVYFEVRNIKIYFLTFHFHFINSKTHTNYTYILLEDIIK